VNSGRNRWFIVACSLAAAEVVAYFAATRFVSPAGTSGAILGDVIYPLAEAFATVTLIVAGSRSTGAMRRFCWWMSVSTATGLCGDITWAINVLIEHVPPSPSLADGFYLSSIAAIFPALASLFGTPIRRWRQALDASLVVVLVVYVSASFVLRPEIEAGLSPAALVAIAETALILLAGVWCIFVVLTADDHVPFGARLIVRGIVVQVASWLVYAWAVTVNGIEDGSWTYTGWQASWALMILGAGATVFGIERMRRARTPASFTWVGSAAMTGLFLATMADASVPRTAPIQLTAAMCGLGLLLVRLHLTLRERGRLADQMHTLAETDALTGVPNRRAFEERLEASAGEALSTGTGVGLLVIDIDHFKIVNDGYGHPFGDAILVQVTRRLTGCLRPSDMLARLGGEEFGVLVHGVTCRTLPELADRCRRVVAADPVVVDGCAVPIRISVGGACMPEHAATTIDLVRIADRALYEAKKRGRNRVHIGLRTSPQVEMPIPQSGIIPNLEALADSHAHADGRAGGGAIVDIAHRLCRELGVTLAERRHCLAAARLRDIGRIGVPPAIRSKRGRLTHAETLRERDHVRVGAELLAALPETQELAPIVAQHHERYDGRGYPAGVSGEEIRIEARIIAVAEAWIAARKGSQREAVRRLRRGAGRELDPVLVDALATLVERGALPVQEMPDDVAA
jgi:diguanylate cyclase (GGDEF)-like protein